MNHRQTKAIETLKETPSKHQTRRLKRNIKLINIYKKYECLWNQCSKDYFNFRFKDQIWQDIADKMMPNSSPDKWKHIIHKLRYKVELERLHQQQAKFYNICDDELPPKLCYAENFRFLNHMFHFERNKAKPLAVAKAEPAMKITSKCMRLSRCKKKTSFTAKLKNWESLRNIQRHSTHVITPHCIHIASYVEGDIKDVHQQKISDSM